MKLFLHMIIDLYDTFFESDIKYLIIFDMWGILFFGSILLSLFNKLFLILFFIIALYTFVFVIGNYIKWEIEKERK